LYRRLTKLEAVTNIPSTEDKWRSLRVRTLQLMSDDDLRIMEEVAVLQEAGEEVASTPEREAMLARYEEATFQALGEQKVRFTVAEMDQLLQDAGPPATQER
jgi:hypothetical protein